MNRYRAQLGALLLLAFVCAVQGAHAVELSKIAPFSDDEFYEFFNRYRAFADCIDNWTAKSGMDSTKIAATLVARGKAASLIAQTKDLLAADSAFRSQIDSDKLAPAERAQLALAALVAQGRSHDPSITRTRHLITMTLARMFAAEASDGSCGPDADFLRLFDKAREP